MIIDLTYPSLEAAALDAPQDVEVVLLGGDPSGREFSDLVTAQIVSLARFLKDVSARSTPSDVLVIIALRPVDDPWEQARSEALLEAVRGMIQATTMEFGASRRLVSVGIDLDQLVDAQQTITFLGGPLGGFVRGAHLDLRKGKR